MRQMFIEERFWKPREDATAEQQGGFRNFWKATDAPNGTHLRQTAGINPVASPRGHTRRPAVAVFLTPSGERHRLPWLDEVDLDNGFIRYFGDNKPELARQAEAAPGNRVLLDEMDLHASDALANRARAAPLLFFRNLGSGEGLPLTEFLGFGLIRQAHRISQLYRGRTFTNYAFDCQLLRGAENVDGREFMDVSWIDARRSASTDDAAALTFAPPSWQKWARVGAAALDSGDVRRQIVRGQVWSYDEQVPPTDSPLGKTLERIYRRYDGNYKHGFQALAAITARRVIAGPGLSYHEGWVTPVGPDGGVDFVQRLDVGSEMASTKLVVLGQAKCKKPWPRSGNGISAEELARVVARLRRGWIGAYVTTTFFTDSAQKELLVDKYPVVQIAGLRLAQTAEEMRDERGLPTIDAFLDWVDGEYVRMLRSARARPSDITRELPSRIDVPDASNDRPAREQRAAGVSPNPSGLGTP